MKRLAAILIAAAASAHAQFAVMHTNGVVTSPTNLTIQQSNVSGLSNALAGKLGTNGSAAGLTGFVGTTNAETARGNLGISNTFAGQFHADFYDDFSRYTNGTIVGDGFVPLKGGAYAMRWGSTNYSSPLIVSNGSVASTNGEIWYLTSQLDRPVYNFGAVVEFDQATVSNNATILIQPDTAWIGRVLHISVTPWSIGVDVSTNGVAGFGGTNTIIFTNYANTAPMLTNSKQTIIGHIEGDTLHLRVGGQVYSASHPFIPLVVGPYFTFESFYLTNNVTNRWHKVWANSQAMADIYSQPLSEELTSLARGYGDFSTRLIVSTNPLSRISDLSTNSKAWFDGNILVNGLVRSKSGTNQFFNIGAVSVQQKQTANSNTNTTNLMTLRTLNILGGLLATSGSRWKATFVGSLANNTNEKRIVLDMAGNQIDLSTTNSGEWILESIVYGTSTNSHEGFAILKGEGFTETARWTFNNGSGVQFDVNLRASSVSNNEVILRGAWADWYP
jgi:hypothetical protein